MHILIAPNAFKTALLSAVDAAKSIREGLVLASGLTRSIASFPIETEVMEQLY